MEVMMMMSSSGHHHDHDTTCSRSRSSSPSASPPVVSTPPSPPPPAAAPEQQQVVASPCAACKILRRRCSAEKCVLAPYFPPTDPLKFATAHKVFGASNIIKLLQELPEIQRADAVSSMVYEANARVRDPVYGSAGAICHLQKQVGQLQAELAKARAEILTLKSNQSHLLAMLCMNLTPPPISNHNHHPTITNTPTTTYDVLPPVYDQDYSELDSPMSDGFLNFYPDATNCTLISWDLL